MGQQARGFAGGKKKSWKEILFVAFSSLPAKHKDLTCTKKMVLTFDPAVLSMLFICIQVAEGSQTCNKDG